MSGTRYYTKDNNNNTGNREDFTSHGVGPNSPESTSSIIDLHDLEQQQNKDMVLDDSTYDFFVEAGLENPSKWSMLGVDMEDLRKQRIITQRRQVQQQQQNITAQNNSFSSSSSNEPNTTILGKRKERERRYHFIFI
ncbi:hypothetical protein BD770DRAFT_194187 [Pilaira anomala]|nr:hypothetical protein BD770DRAFT_194187 [Pilaira anomala]